MDENREKIKGRFYCPGDLSAREKDLGPEESAHVLKSRRMKKGGRLELFNGEGASRRGVIEEASRNRVRIRFDAPARLQEAPLRTLVVAASPPRGDRMTFLVEKLSELGADRFIPTVFQRSLDAGVRTDTAKIARWRRTAIEAAKQCGRDFLLQVEDPNTAEELFAQADGFEEKVIFLTDAKDLKPFTAILDESMPAAGRTLLVIGPQGGITGEEADRALETGMKPATLGDAVLRIETAALAATALFRARGD